MSGMLMVISICTLCCDDYQTMPVIKPKNDKRREITSFQVHFNRHSDFEPICGLIQRDTIYIVRYSSRHQNQTGGDR